MRITWLDGFMIIQKFTFLDTKSAFLDQYQEMQEQKHNESSEKSKIVENKDEKVRTGNFHELFVNVSSFLLGEHSQRRQQPCRC